MLQRLRPFLVLSVVSIPALAAAEEPAAEAPDTPIPTFQGSEPVGAAKAPARKDAAPVVPPPAAEAPPEGLLQGWKLEFNGYFRAPLALGISSRPNPDTYTANSEGKKVSSAPSNLQISYGPNRVVDWSYYSFAYTRLQEQDWVELVAHVKKKHVDAAIGWMGYWLAAAGYRNPDAAGVPAIASLTLDTDFQIAGVTPNVALQMGAWWPGYGYFEKYDTFTLGRFRQIGEELRLTVPVNGDFTAALAQGFGTGRDGSFKYAATQNALYNSETGADLITWVNLQVAYKKVAALGLHYNYEWTADPYLTGDNSPTEPKSYTNAADAHLWVAGAEAKLRLPYAGRLWISPSYISVKNGWALGVGHTGGIEVMHSQNGDGLAANYLALTNSTADSSGTGTLFNVGLVYENSLSNVLGRTPGSAVPDLTVSIFGLMSIASIDLPGGSKISQDTIKSLKYGIDATVQALTWFAFMARFDTVNMNLGQPGYVFSAITARLVFCSHFLSSESIYLQYSRYIYGDKMGIAAQWPWGTPVVQGSDVMQNKGPYFGMKPDENVIKLQATIAF
jgi:hypothetical protein